MNLSEFIISYSLHTDHYERLFHQLIKSNLGESISGLLLLYPGCVIHMIEDIKIIVISHNIPSRLLPRWSFHIVGLPIQYLDDFGNEQSEETMVEECLTLMMKLGLFLSQALKSGSKGPEDNLHDLAPGLLVREQIIFFLIRSERFLKPEEFLAMYNKPINSSVASDLVWPAPQYLLYNSHFGSDS
ncbi:hypothetical protein GDO78_022307 [Eleutherodactylus coqui]|uniref:Uncharacterized protein n=1 Tax=Eleutherodactylus coqui TaxID=57060 RepID=A0A8J6C4U1_ELECQ|nr:hypothetical protein GDO78_022307 [Eleutherodactylus coqui]